jgi:phosphoglycolate phosphatase-like HAD superfamily hydrolase
MIEVINPPHHRPVVAAVDFDGTLSLVRMGWQVVMHDVMKRALAPYHPHLDRIDAEISSYIARSTGQPSIIQMAWVDEHVHLYGGPHHGAQHYLDEFSDAMRERIDTRIATMTTTQAADHHMILGARTFLQRLTDYGVHIALISGTEHHHLIRESKALRIDHFFDAGIYGPGGHAPGFTKAEAMAALVERYALIPGQLLSVGDGPVEISAGKSLDGYCIAVASDEESGTLDLHKRTHLLHAGADAVVANFASIDTIAALLFDGAGHASSTL